MGDLGFSLTPFLNRADGILTQGLNIHCLPLLVSFLVPREGLLALPKATENAGSTSVRLLQQRQRRLRNDIGLRQYGDTSLD